MIANALWRANDLLHGKNTAALPVLLLSSAGVLVVYRHMTQEYDGSDPIKTFLALIVLQMLPLVLIEVKILRCDDPVGLLSKFGPKVFLMHTCFLLLRVCCHPFTEVGTGAYNFVGFVAALITMHVGFKHKWSCRSLWEHRDVGCLAALAAIAAVMTTELDEYFRHDHLTMKQKFLWDAASAASDYIELLAFVPAVWSVYRPSKVLDSIQDSEADRQRSASAFFAFLVAFYFMEDIFNAVSIASAFPLAACGHVAHFLLLLDFTAFLLAHVYNPQKLKECLQHWFPEACCV